MSVLGFYIESTSTFPYDLDVEFKKRLHFPTSASMIIDPLEQAPLPDRRNYVWFALLTVGLFWGVYLMELFTPFRVGHMQRDAMSWIVAAVATLLVPLCTWWRFRRATILAAGSFEVVATVIKIARLSVGVHTRVRLRYIFDEHEYEQSVPIYNSVVSHLQVGSKIPVLVLRRAPKHIQVPMNMEWIG